MKYSKYIRFYDVENDNICFYHSLLVRTVFLSKEEKKRIDLFLERGQSLSKEFERTIEYLYSNYYLVTSEKEDEDIYKQFVNNLPPSVISNTYIIVTENCNFNCRYCFLSERISSSAQKKMSFKTAKASIELLQRTYERQNFEYDRTITFYGGEPLLNFSTIKYFMEEIDSIKSKAFWPSNIKYTIITNGSLLTKEHLNFFKQFNIGLCISYDVNIDSHSNRISKQNESTYDIVKQNIQLCIDYKIPFGLSVTISESTIINKDVILDELESLKPISIGFNMLLPNPNKMPLESYYEDATNFMLSCFERLRKIGIYENRIMRKVRSFIDNKIYLYDCCGCGGNQFVISPDGEIGVCHGYLNNRKYFSSNVFDKEFDFRNNNNFLYWKKRTPLLMQECQDCECIGICGGGCAYAADYYHGTIYAKDDRFCIHAKITLKWLIRDLYKNIAL